MPEALEISDAIVKPEILPKSAELEGGVIVIRGNYG